MIKAREEIAQQKEAERQATLRESFDRLFPEKYAPDVSLFTDGKVETMFRLTYEPAEDLARLMKEARLIKPRINFPSVSGQEQT